MILFLWVIYIYIYIYIYFFQILSCVRTSNQIFYEHIYYIEIHTRTC
ncbi:MAG: hypothetical protein N7Q72_02045 [Spiroplasma sp. Tabriz.8]|nr:hypothetical protein [Spiroplasma sp. Tabriz.8]